MQQRRRWKSFEIAAGADDHYVEESWPMSHGETVIVVVIISIGIVIVIQTVIIPILTSLPMWVSRDGLFSLGKASKVIQPPTIPCIAFACAAFKSHSASYVRSDPPYYTTVTCESLVSREFSRIILKFHFSISVSRYFNFTFTSRKEWKKKSFHFSFLKKSERIIFFTFHFSKKVKLFLISLCFSRKKSEIMQQILRCNI